MKKLFANKPLLITIFAVILLVVIAFASSGDRGVTFIESAVGSVVQPVQSVSSQVSDSVVGFFQDIFNTTDADKENEQLHAKIAQLEQAVQTQEELRLENERLKALLHFAEENETLSYVTARVIGRSTGLWFSSFTLNVGRNRGIEVDMAVVNADGLVGRVTDVGATWCKVTGLIDSRTTVSVVVERTRDAGMIRGTLTDDGGADELELYYLPAGSDLVPGDVIVTSGIGGIFPKGIQIGTVVEVARQIEGGEEQANAIIVPAVDFRRLEEVMIVVNTEAEAGVQ